MKLLIDMNLSPRWIAFFASAGIKAKHWSTLGRSTAPDSEIMAYARTNDYVIVTHDLDFGAILAVTHGDKPSVVQIRSDDVSPDTIGQHVAHALTQLTAELNSGALVTIDPARVRVRVLPLMGNQTS